LQLLNNIQGLFFSEELVGLIISSTIALTALYIDTLYMICYLVYILYKEIDCRLAAYAASDKASAQVKLWSETNNVPFIIHQPLSEAATVKFPLGQTEY